MLNNSAGLIEIQTVAITRSKKANEGITANMDSLDELIFI